MVPASRRTGFQYSRKDLDFGVILGLNSTLLLLIVGNLCFFYFLSGYGNTYLSDYWEDEVREFCAYQTLPVYGYSPHFIFSTQTRHLERTSKV